MTVNVNAIRVDRHRGGRQETADLTDGLAVAAHDVVAPATITLLV